jgi:uncharacterized protein
MKIVVAGGSGFLGEPLCRQLVARGHEVVVLSRDPFNVNAGRGRMWDGRMQGPWAHEMDEADAVINLAGENIGEGRWTEERKWRIIESRVRSTRALVEALQDAPPRERAFVSASAVGYYGPRGDEPLDESAPRGEGFLADVVSQWEEAAAAAEPLARLVVLRFGVVLAKEGGALGKMLLPFRLGGGGPIGSGRQWMSWVDRDDAIAAVEWAIGNDRARGVYNVTAPGAVTNRDFAKALGKAVHRPAILPAPAFALRIALGEMANEMLLAGQRVVPSALLRDGFTFRYPDLHKSLQNALIVAKG